MTCLRPGVNLDEVREEAAYWYRKEDYWVASQDASTMMCERRDGERRSVSFSLEGHVLQITESFEETCVRAPK